MISALGGFLVNLLYALYHGALGLWDGSVWLLSLCIYYTVLAAVRLGAVLCARKGRPDVGTEIFIARFSGGLLILLSLVLGGVSYLSLVQNTAVRHDTILMITIATYTFTKLGMAITKAVRWRKDPSLLLAVVRCVDYTQMAVSLFSMQRSMIASFGGETAPSMMTMNILSGGIACFFPLVLGSSLIYKAHRKIK